MVVSNFFSCVKSWCDFFKNFLKAEIVSFVRNKRKNLPCERIRLVNRIINLKLKLIAGDSLVAREIIDLEDELKVLTFKELDGSKVCSRVQWLE